jgi:hypothetical protein
MKKLLLLLTITGIAASSAFSQTAAFDLYEGGIPYSTLWRDANETAIQINPMYDQWGNLSLNNPEPVGVAYLKSQIEDNNFSEEGLIVYYLDDSEITMTGEGYLNGQSYNARGEIPQSGYYAMGEANLFDPGLGRHTFGPALFPVVKSNTYKGAPLVLDVKAMQSDFNESKDVLIDYYLLLGEGRGQAYVEYWFRPDYGTWTKIGNPYLSNQYGETAEGLTIKSGKHYGAWFAGAQLGNQLKTTNAQIRVTARYGEPSGWDGTDPFVTSDSGYTSPTGGTGTDPYTTDSDGDGVMDAYDDYPNDPSRTSDGGGYSSPTGG